MTSVTTLLNEYGYIILLIALFLELIAFPLPGELLMSYCGYLVYLGKLNFYISVLFSFTGTVLGITTSYMIGKKLGIPFFNRFGKYIHLGPDRIEKTSKWFEKFGNRLLIFAFFIIGVRHITGYFSGITKIKYKRFAINTYLGAFIWTTTFIYLGKIFGTHYKVIHTKVSYYFLIIALSIIGILIIIYLLKTYKNRLILMLNYLLNKLIYLYQSFRKTKILITIMLISTLLLLILVVGIIQDFLGHEFTDFNQITTYILQSIFKNNWRYLMRISLYLISFPMIFIYTLILIYYLLQKKQHILLHLRMIVFTLIGGWLFKELLIIIFSKFTYQLSFTYSKHTFPSGQTFIALTTFGLLLYYFLYFIKNLYLIHIATIITLVLSLWIGISVVILDIQTPIDVVFGYATGALWLGVNLIMQEVNSLLYRMKKVGQPTL